MVVVYTKSPLDLKNIYHTEYIIIKDQDSYPKNKCVIAFFIKDEKLYCKKLSGEMPFVIEEQSISTSLYNKIKHFVLQKNIEDSTELEMDESERKELDKFFLDSSNYWHYKITDKYALEKCKQNLFLYSKQYYNNIYVFLDYLILFWEATLKDIALSNSKLEYRKIHSIKDLLNAIETNHKVIEKNKDLINMITTLEKNRNKIRYGEVDIDFNTQDPIFLLQRSERFLDQIMTGAAYDDTSESIIKIKPLKLKPSPPYNYNRYIERSKAYYISFIMESIIHWQYEVGGSLNLSDLIFSIELLAKAVILEKTGKPSEKTPGIYTHDISSLIKEAISHEKFHSLPYDTQCFLEKIKNSRDTFLYHEALIVHGSHEDKYRIHAHGNTLLSILIEECEVNTEFNIYNPEYFQRQIKQSTSNTEFESRMNNLASEYSKERNNSRVPTTKNIDILNNSRKK